VTVVVPQRDLWWQAQRIAVPDSADLEVRHRRGVVRLPYELGPDEPAGHLVAAWVCCDPACGGVSLNWAGLDRDHGCCDTPRLKDSVFRAVGEHRADWGRVGRLGYFHGDFTDFWEPGS
jgi:hypothetical protein